MFFTKNIPIADKDFRVKVEYNAVYGIEIKDVQLIASNGISVEPIDFTKFFKQHLEYHFSDSDFYKEIKEFIKEEQEQLL